MLWPSAQKTHNFTYLLENFLHTLKLPLSEMLSWRNVGLLQNERLVLGHEFSFADEDIGLLGTNEFPLSSFSFS